jgi:hypothetical protein
VYIAQSLNLFTGYAFAYQFLLDLGNFQWAYTLKKPLEPLFNQFWGHTSVELFQDLFEGFFTVFPRCFPHVRLPPQ